MVTIVPADAITEALHAFGVQPQREGDWWVAYHWFCEQFSNWKHRGRQYAVLCGRAKCGCLVGEYDPLCDREEPIRRLAYLFAHVKPNWIDRESRGKPRVNFEARFLRHCEIRKWQDLLKSIRFPGWRPKVFPKREWFEMRGRTFKKSPNHYHPKAVSVFRFTFELQERKGWLQWVGRICYGYPHNCSSWYVDIPQIRGEPLDKYATRIDHAIDELLVPEQFDHGRKCYEVDWERTRLAVGKVFGTYDCRLDANGLTDLLMDGYESHPIQLDDHRLATVKRWIRADKRKRRKEKEKSRHD